MKKSFAHSAIDKISKKKRNAERWIYKKENSNNI